MEKFGNIASVLIDTWWNVNQLKLPKWLKTPQVLIDTWWNVNFSPLSSVCLSLSFNRYMVECELVKSHLRMLCHLVLIDTWWNVNITFKAKYIANTTF